MNKRLPNFLIIGAAKGGTTALYDYLVQHPDVFMCHPKEPHFFAFEGQTVDFRGPRDDQRINRVAVTEQSRYEALFAGVGGQRAVGEASVSYLYTDGAAERIRRRLPDAKLICMLRDPVPRAFSSYMYMRTQLREPLDDFTAALDAEPQRIRDGWQHLWHYQQMGFYAGQLRRFLDRFSPEQVKVVIFDDFKADPRGVLAETLQFLQLDSSFQPRFEPQPNRSGRAKSQLLQTVLQTRTPMHRLANRIVPKSWKQRLLNSNLRPVSIDPPVARRLAELYRDDVAELSELINRDLTHWTRKWLEVQP